MRQFAEAAVVHAAEQHGETLTYDAAAIATVDRILNRHRKQDENRESGPLSLCYGSWIGELACQRLSARWVGLHEPHPPRLEVAGVLCSPIEAVARRLTAASEPLLVVRWEQMQRWVRDAPQPVVVRQENQRAWDAMSRDLEFVLTDESLQRLPSAESAAAALDPWLAEMPRPCRLLCLAAAGGRHSALYAMNGFQVTVVDLSPQMLAIDARLAAAHRLDVATLHGSMDDLSALDGESFDCVVQPVSACYVPDVLSVYAEVARVLRDGGLYVLQQKQPASLQASGPPLEDEGFSIVHRAFAGQQVRRASQSETHLEPGTREFIHPLGALLGGLCQSGFVIEDVAEPPRADIWADPDSSAYRACYLPPYLKIKARRTSRQQ